MRDEKEERKKQARSNKQTRQSNTAHPRQSLFLEKMSCLGWDSNPRHVHLNDHIIHCKALSLTVVQAVDINGRALEEWSTQSVRLEDRPLVIVGMVTTHGVCGIVAMCIPQSTHCMIHLTTHNDMPRYSLLPLVTKTVCTHVYTVQKQ